MLYKHSFFYNFKSISKQVTYALRLIISKEPTRYKKVATSMIVQIKSVKVLDVKIRFLENWFFGFGPKIRPLFRRKRYFAETFIFG